jgi:hypothetical protein
MRERREGCYTRESLECLLVLVGNHARRAHNAAKPDVREQQLGEAEDLMDELRERMRAVSWPADDELSGSVLRDFAQLLQIRGRWDESELPLLEAWRVFDRREPVCRDQLEKLAAHWDAVDRWDDAARLRELIGD